MSVGVIIIAALLGYAVLNSDALTSSTKLGEYFTLGEMTTTNTGLPNDPTAEALGNLKLLVATILDPLRKRIGKPVHINSAYRSPAVNAAVKGSSTSQHMTGEAADIRVDGMSAQELARELLALGASFDQLIWYHPSQGGHVHISIDPKPRKQVLYRSAGKKYISRRP